MTDRPIDATVSEDRMMPAIVYGLYLLGVVNGLTALVGLVLAMVNRGRAGERMRTHYTFQIRSCWLWLAWMAIGILLIALGAPFSFLLIGIPLFAAGWAIVGLVEAWFIVRAAMGAVYLARDEPYPRPRTWFF